MEVRSSIAMYFYYKDLKRQILTLSLIFPSPT